VLQWQYYVACSHTLKKVFVSVKGIYYQCEVMGETITWLAPHAYAQKLPKEVDFRVMLTFLDFYEVFLRFVLFKLYSTLGRSYPPVENKLLLDSGSFLLALRPASLEVEAGEPQEGSTATLARSSNEIKSLGKKRLEKLETKLIALEDEEGVDEDDVEVDIATPLGDVFADFHGTAADGEDLDREDQVVFRNVGADGEGVGDQPESASYSLFKGLCFFIGREVPLDMMQLCILSLGGQIGWESDTGDSPYSRDDSRITHQVEPSFSCPCLL
jgi:pescadillo